MKIGIIGLGKMGSAIAQGLSGNYEIFGFEKSEAVIKSLRPSLLKKIRLATSLDALIDEAQTIIIATKPAQAAQVVEAVPDHRLIISIAAGIALKTLDAQIADHAVAEGQQFFAIGVACGQRHDHQNPARGVTKSTGQSAAIAAHQRRQQEQCHRQTDTGNGGVGDFDAADGSANSAKPRTEKIIVENAFGNSARVPCISAPGTRRIILQR